MAEYLPALMLEPEDRTDDFRASISDLALRYEAFNWAIAIGQLKDSTQTCSPHRPVA